MPHGSKIDWKMEDNHYKGSKMPYYNITHSPPIILPLAPNVEVESFKVLHLVTPYQSRERRGLGVRKMMRLLTPWIQENPIFFHMTNSTSSAVRGVLDQMKEVGFEMMIYSFGGDFNMESTDQTYIDSIRDSVEYAKSLGIEVGGYDLIALSRHVRKEWMAINEFDYSSPYASACFASGWYDDLLNKTLSFLEYTGISMVETDGPYGGYTCKSQTHQHHHGLEDSVYQQNRLQSEFFKILRNRKIYINQPDIYYFQVSVQMITFL